MNSRRLRTDFRFFTALSEKRHLGLQERELTRLASFLFPAFFCILGHLLAQSRKWSRSGAVVLRGKFSSSARLSWFAIGTPVVLSLTLTLLLAGTNVYAARWFDDFNDGNALDGSPLTWSEHPLTPGSFDASSGDYVISGLGPVDDEFMFSVIQTVTFQDVSVRVQGRVADGGNLGIAARADFNTITGYSAFIDDDGQIIVLATTDPTGPLNVIGQNESGILATTDVILQLDVVGSLLTVTAWRPGDPMPAPQISVTDTIFSAGVSGVVFAEDNNSSRGIYVFAESVSVVLGDTDRTGAVERSDAMTILNNLGTSLEATVASGDVDADGLVGIGDLAIVQSTLGAGTPASPVAVPEPASTILLLLAIGLLSGRFVRQHERRR